MKRILSTIIAVQMGVALLYGSSHVDKTEQARILYPLPAAIVMNAYRYLGKLQHFSVDAVTTNDDYFEGKIIATFTHKIHIDLQRPDRLHIDVDGDLKHRSFYLDRGDFTMVEEDLDYYGKIKVPEKIDSALDRLFENYKIKTALANILYSNLDKRLTPKEKGYYFGISQVEGVPCYHIGFSNEVQALQLWIEKGIRPLIRKFIVIDKTEKYLPRSGTLLHWHLHPEYTPSTFQFIPSDNSVEIVVASFETEEK